MTIKTICSNKRAFYEYEIEEKLEAGLVLQGTEVKAVRFGKVNIGDGWVKITDSGAFLQQIHITHYEFGNIYNHEEERPRQLLLSKAEIRKLKEKSEAKGYAIIPLRIYIKGSWIKVELGLGKGKKDYDKRQATKTRDANREIQRMLRHKQRRGDD